MSWKSLADISPCPAAARTDDHHHEHHPRPSPRGAHPRLSRAVTSDARASLTRRQFHMAMNPDAYPAASVMLAGMMALFALVFPFALEGLGALASVLVTDEPREVSTGLEGRAWVFWAAAAVPAAVAAARLPRPQGRLEAVPGFVWKARSTEGGAHLALVPETGTRTPLVDVVVSADSAAQEVSVDLTQDRTVVLTHPAGDGRDWTEDVVRAVNDLRTYTGDFTRLPYTLPGVGGRDGEELSVAYEGDVAVVNGYALGLADEPGERRLIGAAAAAWLTRRLEVEAAAANRPALEAASARSELDRETLERLLPAHVPGGEGRA